MKFIFKKIFLFILAFFFLFSLVACNKTDEPVKEPDKQEEQKEPEEQKDPEEQKEPEEPTIVLTKTLELNGENKVDVGATITLTASFDEGAEVELVWTSSDTSILTVDNGVVTGIAAGTSKVTVKDNKSNLFKELEITVNVVDNTDYQKLLNDFVATLPEQTIENLPTKIDEKYQVTYVFSDKIAENGVITRGDEENYTVSGKVVLNGFEKDYEVTIVGTYIDNIANTFIAQFENIDGDLRLTKSYDDYGGTNVIWKTPDTEILTTTGKYTRPFNDTYITINYTVKTKDPASRIDFSKQVIAKGKDLDYKNGLVEEWICKIYEENSVLYKEDVLPTYCDDYEANIVWFDKDGNTPNLEKLAQDPVLGDTVVLTVRVTYPNSDKYKDFVLDYRVWNKRYTSTEEKVEDFLNSLHQDSIRSYKYWALGYEENNMGYVPFYDTNDAVINTEYLLEYTYGYVCTGILKTSTEYICVHDTAGALPTHTALQFAQSQQQKNTNKNNTEYISWHFTVGNDGIYQSLPLDEVGYHAGDGSRVYGTTWYSSTYNKADCIGGGNRNSIGIESCINHGSDYNDTMRILAKLVAELLLEYNLSFDRIKQHNDFSGKDCPGVIRHCKRWDEFKNLVKLEYFAKTELQGVDFEWTSLCPEILDDTGHILQNNGSAFQISYKVKYTIDGVSKEKEFTSTIEEQGYISIGDY